MKDLPTNYNLFFKFIETYSPVGFKGIDPDSPLLQELERMMEKSNQFFFVGDMIQMKILFTSKRSTQMIGIEPEDLTPYHFFEATHPDDIHWHNLGRSKVFNLAQNLFIEGKGEALLSTNLKLRKPDGEYICLLFQCYLFYSANPYKTVYMLQINTDVDWCKRIKHGYHHYVGNDYSFFRYPDEEMLKQGNIFSDREFAVIRLVEAGFSSEQIAKKLFISTNTVNTHRRNIIKKSGKTSLTELIHTLKEGGVL